MTYEQEDMQTRIPPLPVTAILDAHQRVAQLRGRLNSAIRRGAHRQAADHARALAAELDAMAIITGARQ